MQFPNFLREAMETQGLNQQELSVRSTIDQGSISRYLRGKASPKAAEIIKLAAALKVSIDWLLTGSETAQGAKGFLAKIEAAKNAAMHNSPDIESAEAEFDQIMQIPNGHRTIRVRGWAHAGEALAYEELPEHWQCEIVTDCRDPQAFAVKLEGDSMAESYHEGDQLVLMPGTEPHSGCFAVCRFKDGSFVFRRIELLGESVSLVPENKRYNPTTHHRSEFDWIYPIWESRRQLWKR